MSKISWKGSTLLGPLPPALVTCGTVEQPRILTLPGPVLSTPSPP